MENQIVKNSFSTAKMTLWALLDTVPSLRLDKIKNICTQIVISNITADSREVINGTLFFAMRGAQHDGRAFIEQALANGAKAILLDEPDVTQHSKYTIPKHSDSNVTEIAESKESASQDNQNSSQINQHPIPVIHIYELANYISGIADIFYGSPSNKIDVVGVTGTNGKTTTTQLVAQWSQLLNKPSAIIGTIGYGPYGNLHEANNTTPSPILVQEELSAYVRNKLALCAVEVSSHGLTQHRVAAVNFAVGAFLNLSRDHLDYHGNMENYENAKWSLFAHHNVKQQVINIDDPVGLKWIEKLPNAVWVSLDKGTQHQSKMQSHRFVKLTDVTYHVKGAHITFSSSWGNGTIDSQLLGEFNVSNILMALAILLTLDYPFEALIQSAAQLKPITGRMEVITNHGKPTVVVDYAHTPDALEKALASARIHCDGELWCVFGCGGDRDKGKRPLMGSIAEQFADKVVITDDNPRTENNTQITQEILNGLTDLNQTRIQVINDRTAAIEYAVENASASDVIVIAGKGHEDYQIVGTTKHYFSDQLVVAKLLGVIA